MLAPAPFMSLSTGGDGVVYTWDLRSQRCLSRAVDEGTLTGASLACSWDYFASGSDGGVVNLHRRDATGAMNVLTRTSCTETSCDLEVWTGVLHLVRQDVFLDLGIPEAVIDLLSVAL